MRLEWLCLLASVASGGAGSPLHVFITALEGNRTRRHVVRLLLVGGSFLLRRLRTGRLITRTGIEAPVVLLLAGQALPHALTRDGRRYLPKACRTAAALGVYYALLGGGRRAQASVATGVVLNAAICAIQWPTTWDFAAYPAYYGPLQRIGLAINRRFRPLPGPLLQKNRAGSIVAPAIPIAIVLAWEHWKRRRVGSPARVAFFGLLPILSAGGLLLTFSRMSWLAAGGGSAVLALAAVQRRWFPAPAKRALFWTSVALPAMLALVMLGRKNRPGSPLRRLLEPIQSVDGRWSLVKDGIALVRDYPYTGVGNESMTLIHSTYALLHHVPRYSHLHNVYVETWLEDGLLGAAGLAWGALTCLRWGWHACGRPDLPPLAAAGFASLAAMGILGLGDDPFVHGVRRDSYTTDAARTRALLTPGVLLGAAAGLARAGLPDEIPRCRAPWAPLLGGPLLAGWVVLRRRALMAAWHANIGALLQSRVELRLYDPSRYERPLLDQIRRDRDLATAEDRFHRALAWDPRNATALQRLGGIALSRGRYSEATILLQQAWGAGHRDRVTRLLYGDVLVAEGRGAEAAEVLRGLPLAASRLRFQAWYRYESRGDRARAEQASRAAGILEAGGGD